MSGLLSDSELIKLIDQRIKQRVTLGESALAKVASITPGAGIQLQFAEDTAPANTLYNIISTYDSTTPQVGDVVLCDQHPTGGVGASVTIIGKIGALPTAQIVPTGAMIPYGGPSAPFGWLLCDGSAVSRTTYANLFNVIGTTYGAGDGSTTFNIPNMQGKVPVGVGDAGPTFHGHTSHTLGQTGGEETHKLTTAEMPAHAHTITPGGFFQTTSIGVTNTVSNGGSTTGSTGSDQDHNNMQPFLVVNYIIKT